MKKRLSILLLVVLALSLVLGSVVTASAEPTEPSAPTESTAPTDPGETTAPTDPGESTAPTDPTQPPQHTHHKVVRTVKESTCTEQGITEEYCSECNEVLDRWEEPLAPHTKGTRVTEATCTEPGYTIEYCLVCDTELDRWEDVPAKGHHKVTEEQEEPTCTKPSYFKEYCDVCGEVTDYEEFAPALGHSWDKGKVTTQPTYTKEGVKTYTCTVCGETMTEAVPKKPRPGKTDEEQPVAEDIPALPYGSIVSDIARAAQPYEAEIVEESENHVLVITAEPDETGAYVLRNLHIDDELLAKLAEDHIEIVRFVVGTATVEFPAASFTGEVMTAIKADLASPAKEFIVTVDPTATTAEGNPGCSVSASIACEDGSEFDITGVVEGLTVTMNGVAQAVTEAAVYAA